METNNSFILHIDTSLEKIEREEAEAEDSMDTIKQITGEEGTTPGP
jgi:hypothetical protein